MYLNADESTNSVANSLVSDQLHTLFTCLRCVNGFVSIFILFSIYFRRLIYLIAFIVTVFIACDAFEHTHSG